MPNYRASDGSEWVVQLDPPPYSPGTNHFDWVGISESYDGAPDARGINSKVFYGASRDECIAEIEEAVEEAGAE